jgi:hypothetical protein
VNDTGLVFRVTKSGLFCVLLFIGVYVPNTKNGIFTGLTSVKFQAGKDWQKKTGARAPRMVKKIRE